MAGGTEPRRGHAALPRRPRTANRDPTSQNRSSGRAQCYRPVRLIAQLCVSIVELRPNTAELPSVSRFPANNAYKCGHRVHTEREKGHGHHHNRSGRRRTRRRRSLHAAPARPSEPRRRVSRLLLHPAPGVSLGRAPSTSGAIGWWTVSRFGRWSWCRRRRRCC